MNTQRTIRSAALILFFTVASMGCIPNTAAETKENQTTIPSDIPTRKTFTITPTFSPTPDPRAGWTSFTSRLNSARDMEFDKDGYLWVVPNGKEGIVRWDVKEKSFVRYTEVNGLPDLTVSSVAAEPDGGVWVGFDNPFGKTIARFKNGEWKNFSGPDNHFGAINSMVVGPNGVLWMVYGDEVVSFDGNSWKYFDEEISRFTEKPYQGPYFSIIAAAPNGNIWAVTKTKGLLFYDGDTWISMSGQNGLSDERIQSLSIGPDGMVWVITARTDKTTLFTYDDLFGRRRRRMCFAVAEPISLLLRPIKKHGGYLAPELYAPTALYRMPF